MMKQWSIFKSRQQWFKFWSTMTKIWWLSSHPSWNENNYPPPRPHAKQISSCALKPFAAFLVWRSIHLIVWLYSGYIYISTSYPWYHSAKCISFCYELFLLVPSRCTLSLMLRVGRDVLSWQNYFGLVSESFVRSRCNVMTGTLIN